MSCSTAPSHTNKDRWEVPGCHNPKLPLQGRTDGAVTICWNMTFQTNISSINSSDIMEVPDIFPFCLQSSPRLHGLYGL